MRSGWWWGSEEWKRYLAEYAKTRPECLNEWKSSPLANDHDFSDVDFDDADTSHIYSNHLSQVIDLRTHKWSDVRKSYHSIIHRGQERYTIEEDQNILLFRLVHHCAFGNVRNAQTFAIQQEWMRAGNAMAVTARNDKYGTNASALWVIYKDCAYYASGPSTENNTMHAVIWKSLQLLKERGVTLVELGQIDGETEKEKNIGKFKAGFGGEAKTFTIVRRLP